MEREKARIGIVGTGLIGSGLARLVMKQTDMELARILTRRDISQMSGYPSAEKLTNSVSDLIEHSDLIVECSGDILYGTSVLTEAAEAGLPIVTMNAELQVTTGSYFAQRCFITEAEGDQPGCLAALNENVLQMGFKPVVYGNIKGFLNINPSEEDMRFWSKKNGTTLNMTTSFTDGTKVQIEQALIANGLDAGIACKGLLGIEADDAQLGGNMLAESAKKFGKPISDYILTPKLPPGVFITAEHDDSQKDALRYFKMGVGPYYTLLTNYHLCHLEVVKTIRRVITGGSVLLNNSSIPKVSVAAIAKREIKAGDYIKQGIGSFDVRGEAVTIADYPDHLPIGLLNEGRVKRTIEPGEMIQFSDIEIPESIALQAWSKSLENSAAPIV